jgi:hypothetical protein
LVAIAIAIPSCLLERAQEAALYGMDTDHNGNNNGNGGVTTFLLQ